MWHLNGLVNQFACSFFLCSFNREKEKTWMRICWVWRHSSVDQVVITKSIWKLNKFVQCSLKFLKILLTFFIFELFNDFFELFTIYFESFEGMSALFQQFYNNLCQQLVKADETSWFPFWTFPFSNILLNFFKSFRIVYLLAHLEAGIGKVCSKLTIFQQSSVSLGLESLRLRRLSVKYKS